MTHAQAALLFNLVRAAYPGTKFGPDTVDLWLSELRRLDHARGDAAVRSLITSCRFWPSLAELAEQVAIVTEKQAAARRAQERRDADEAFDAIEMPPLAEIPAAREYLHRLMPLDAAIPGACDDCGKDGRRYTLGRFRVCGDCGRRRSLAAQRLERMDAA